MYNVILGHFIEGLRAGGKDVGAPCVTGMLQWLLLAWSPALQESSHESRLLGLFLVCVDLTWMESLS